MVQLSNESIQKFKELMEEKSGKEVTWEEAAEGGRNLVTYLMFYISAKWNIARGTSD